MTLKFERNGFQVLMKEPDKDGAVEIALSGRIHEWFDSSVIGEITADLARQPVKTLGFRLGDVSSINSVGIRNWVPFLETLDSAYQIHFLEVGDIFVDLTLLIPNLLGKLSNRVTALRLPYHCESCGRDSTQTYGASELRDKDGEFRVPDSKCKACGKVQAFAASEADYARFVRFRC